METKREKIATYFLNRKAVVVKYFSVFDNKISRRL
jgi:hypothetical protein